MNQTLTRHTSTRPASETRATAATGGELRDRTSPRGLRGDVCRPPGRQRSPRPRAGTVCQSSHRAPRVQPPAPIGWAPAMVVGIGLAVVMWAMVVGGFVFADSAAPAVSGTAVVHVRGGESLGELATRVAPEQSTASVVATIKELNHMSGSGLTVGQPLLAPIYRR